jgi:uroporphyrinogen decarboxylase
MSNDLKLVATLKGQTFEKPPLWMMRQAGRYLPEYREVRSQAPNFVQFCYNPDLAVEVTLQPIRRYGFDAAILFSDILVVPDALGVDVRFVEGEGPRLEQVLNLERMKSFRENPLEYLAPVMETVRRLRAELPRDVTLIGFCGAPWTVATYMIGGGGDDQQNARMMVHKDGVFVSALLDHIADVSADYLAQQVKAGANVVQIFDTWANALPHDLLEAYSFRPVERLIKRFRLQCPDTPVILFFKGVWPRLAQADALCQAQGYSLDWTADVKAVRAQLRPNVALQGALDPMALLAGGEGLERAIDRVMVDFSGGPHIFNLGHGIVPQTPPAHVEQLVKRVKG